MKGLIDYVVSYAVSKFFEKVANCSEKEGARLCERLVRLIIRVVPRYRTVGLKNLELVFPEKSVAERDAIFNGSLNVIARNLYWLAKAPKLTPKDIPSLMEYTEAAALMEKFRSSKVGGLVVTAHFGLYELVSIAQAIIGRPYAVLFREFGLPRLDKIFRDRRENFGHEVFGRKGGFKEALSRMQRGQDVAILYDQNVRIDHAAFIDLFGKPAATTKTVAYLALRTGCPIAFASSVENPPERQHLGKYRIYAREIPNPNTLPGDTEEKVHAFLRLLNAELENLIRFWPEGWFWIHRRWKTRPEGEAEDFYK